MYETIALVGKDCHEVIDGPIVKKHRNSILIENYFNSCEKSMQPGLCFHISDNEECS